jgi:hypothetical protein
VARPTAADWRSTDSVRVTAGTGHYIQYERPPLVAEAVREVVAAARTGARLLPCSRAAFRALGGSCLANALTRPQEPSAREVRYDSASAHGGLPL